MNGLPRAFFLLLLTTCKARSEAPDAAVVDAAADVVAAPASVETGCRAYASAMCAAFQRCEPNETEVMLGAGKACEDRLFGECSLPAQVPGVTVTNESLLRCAKSLSDKACPVVRADEDCADPKGTLALGAACTSGSQCQSLNCDTYAKDAKGGCGICAPERPVRARNQGQKLGQRCDDNVRCGWHLACVKSVCKEKGKLGDSCVAGVSDSCVLGTTCEKGKCIAVTLRQAGESCTSGALGLPSGPSPCAPGLGCEKGVCVKHGLEGDACTKGGTRCAFPFHCVADKCVTPAARFQSCAAN